MVEAARGRRSSSISTARCTARLPKRVPGVSWAVAETKNETSGGVAVVTRKLVGHVDNSGYPLINVDIELYLTTPTGAKACR